MTRVTVSAPAKINLHLAVGARRRDGYHDVVTILQTLALADEVSVEPSSELELHFKPDLGIPPEENLALRAAFAAAEAFGRPPALAIRVVKRIPAAAGLGGGSSDAAAVLAACAALWGEDAEDPRLAATARALGADVPFFLLGGAALYAGRGDELVRRVRPLESAVVLAAPNDPVPTAAAYAAFDSLPPATAPDAAPMLDALESADAGAVSRMLYNNLTEAALVVTPSIADVLSAMRSARGIRGALVSGSGSAVFGLAEDERAAQHVAAELGERGWWSVATATTGVVSVRMEGAS